MPLPKPSRLCSLLLILLGCVAYLGQELVLENYWLRSKVPRVIYKIWSFDEKEFGIIVLIIASLAFGIFSPKIQFWWNDDTVIPTAATGSFSDKASRYLLILTWLVMLGGLSCTISSQYSYLKVGDTFGTRSWWLLGIGLFGVALVVSFIRENRDCHWRSSPAFTHVHWATLSCIVIAAFMLRFWDVAELPRKVNYDVAGTGLYARRNFSSPGWQVFGLGDFGVAHLSFAATALSMKIFGDNLFGLKMTSVIFGTLMIPASYFAAWRSFDCHRVAAITAAVLATNIPHIHFSRHIMNIDPWSMFTVSLFFIAHGLRASAAWALGAAGIFVALAVHLYLSGRVLCFAVPLFFLIALRNKSTWRSPVWQGMAFFAIGVFVLFGPNVVDIWINSGEWKESNRPWSTFLLIRNLTDYANSHHFATIPQLFMHRLWTILLLLYTGDASGQSPIRYPFFNTILTPLFWLGLGVSFFEMKRNPVQLLLFIVVFLTVVLGIGLAPVSTYWPKILSLTIIGAIFIARGGMALANACGSLLLPTGTGDAAVKSRSAAWGNVISQLGIVIVFGVMGAQNWNSYRVEAAKDTFDASVLARYVAGLPEGMKVCGANDPNQHVELKELPVQFLANKQERRAFADKSPDALIPECGSAPFVWIVTSNQTALKDTLLRTFPNGKLEEQNWPGGGHLFSSFTVAK